jgi:hypothetical protein
VTAWLAAPPLIDVVARDRAASYTQAATSGRPNAIQVADRWRWLCRKLPRLTYATCGND